MTSVSSRRWTFIRITASITLVTRSRPTVVPLNKRHSHATRHSRAARFGSVLLELSILAKL